MDIVLHVIFFFQVDKTVDRWEKGQWFGEWSRSQYLNQKCIFPLFEMSGSKFQFKDDIQDSLSKIASI